MAASENNFTGYYYPLNSSATIEETTIKGLYELWEDRVDITLGRIYFYLTAIMSVLSMAGSVLIVITYRQFKELRTTGRQLLVFLSLVDFLTAFGNFMGIMWYIRRDYMDARTSDILCNVHASLTFFSSVSSFLWTVAMAIHLYFCIVRLDSITADRLVPYFHMACWSIPVIIGVVPWAMGVIGHDKALRVPSWCWIDPNLWSAIFWQYFTGKAWEIASYIIVVVLYARIKVALCRQVRKTEYMVNGGSHLGHLRNSEVITEANRKLTFVPAVFISMRIWGTLRFIIGAHLHHYINNKSTAWIVPLQGVGDSAQGFANCVLFCLFTAKVRSCLMESIRHKCCPSPKRYALSNGREIPHNSPDDDFSLAHPQLLDTHTHTLPETTLALHRIHT